MLVTLFLANGNMMQRFVRPAWFMVAMSFVPFVLTFLFWASTQANTQDALNFLSRTYWAGTGVGTGWCGFSLVKVVLGIIGIAESFVGGGHVAWEAGVNWPEIGFGLLIFAVLVGFAASFFWQNQNNANVFAATALLAGTFIAGMVFNLYVQPHEAQFVIN